MVPASFNRSGTLSCPSYPGMVSNSSDENDHARKIMIAKTTIMIKDFIALFGLIIIFPIGKINVKNAANPVRIVAHNRK